MKNLNELLAEVVEKDNALTGFGVAELPEAAMARILNTLCSLEKHFTSDELAIIKEWCGLGFKAATFSTNEGMLLLHLRG